MTTRLLLVVAVAMVTLVILVMIFRMRTVNKPKSRIRRTGETKTKRKKEKPKSQESQPKNNSDDSKQPAPKKKNKNKNRGRNNNKSNAKKFPWRKEIPSGAVDPITLDPLKSLQYPPFALCATKPYVPVKEWPVKDDDYAAEKDTKMAVNNDKQRQEEENIKRLQEQWGSLPTKNAGAIATNASSHHHQQKQQLDKDLPPPSKRPYNLYDGYALAFYLVSQLQFIDPLNRRDLTRDELVNLDRYLVKYSSRQNKAINVTQAYDAKGVTISTAGAAGHTAEGRAQMLQEQAQVLLNAMFASSAAEEATPQPSESAGGDTSTNLLQQQYASHQERTNTNNNRRGGRQRQQQHQRRRQDHDDVGIYAYDPENENNTGGMIIIDDDVNPGLRGSGFRRTATEAANNNTADAEMSAANSAFPNNGSFWSASHIADRYNHAMSNHESNFPSLSATTTDTGGDANAANAPPPEVTRRKKTPPAPSKSLLNIGNLVKKTDPAELERQRKAREEAQRRAALSQLSFVVPGAATAAGTAYGEASLLSVPQQEQGKEGPTEGQLERNRAFASALGVAPSTVRNYNSGWARPTNQKVEHDEFGNELFTAQYPDALIGKAKETYLDQLLRVEKKWKTFLQDDTAASCPLRPMDKPLRTFVHEYSDFWHLHTESFDREPQRYIHCVKLRDTSQPYPLLSDVARTWRGRPPGVPPAIVTNRSTTTTSAVAGAGVIHQEQQAAGQSTTSREFPPPPERVPLQLKPRSLQSGQEGIISDGDQRLGQLQQKQEEELPPGTTGVAGATDRFGSLFVDRERPKLSLAPRSLPTELPPPEKHYNPKEEAKRRQAERAEKERKEREEMNRKQKLLEAAFASSDEEEDGSDISSDWEEQQAIYSGSDEEE